MSAYLKNEEDPMDPVITIFSHTWTRDDESLLRKIETVVYDHPQLLDDFSTEIIINTERALWIPRKIVEPSPGKEEKGIERDETDLYNVVYKAEEEDIFIDETGDKICVYSLVSGLQSFIRRTLPGARTWCQQTLAVRRFTEQVSDMPRLYVDIRDVEADFYGFEGKKLLFAATHGWRDKMDIVYHIYNFMELWHLDHSDTQVMVSGKKDIRNELMKILRNQLQYVMLTMLPSSVSKSDLPVAVGLVIARR